MKRRDFVRAGGSCLGYLSLVGAVLPTSLRSWFAVRPGGETLAAEPWARIEKLGEGVWACVSTPLTGGADAMRTFSNGGIVAGSSGVLVVEGFASDAGARWISQMSKELTGRTPTHVVLTHYHGDHSAGLGGYHENGASFEYVSTSITRDLLRPNRAAVADLLKDAEIVEPGASRVIDLGSRKVTVTPRSGHTASDLTVTVDDPRVLFAGDLVWNGLFPNYVDAIPSVLGREVRMLERDGAAIKVPGHGSVMTGADFAHYVALLDLVEGVARRAHAVGQPADVAARELVIPPSLGPWGLFGETYYQVALRAWERELGRAGAP